jgi:3-dehydroshikimate dehydratase
VKFSFSTVAWRFESFDIKDMIHIVSMLGYDGIEIWEKHLLNSRSHPASLRLLLDHAKLDVPLISSYFDFTSTEMAWRASVKLGADTIRRASMLGSGLIRAFTGTIGSDSCGEKKRRACIEGIRCIAREAGPHNISIAIETHMDTLADTTGSARSLVEDIGMPNVGLVLDIANMYETEPDPDYRIMIERLFPYVLHVHVKNAEKNLKAESPFYSVMNHSVVRNEFRNLDKGYLDYKKIIEELMIRGYSHYVSVECFERNRNQIRFAHDELVFLRKTRDGHSKGLLKDEQFRSGVLHRQAGIAPE